MIKITDPSVVVALPWEDDPAIDAERSDIQAFRKEPTEAMQHVVAKPGEHLTIYHCRPLTAEQYQRAIQQATLSMPKGAGYVVVHAAQSLAALAIGLDHVESFRAPGDNIKGADLAEVFRLTKWDIQYQIGGKILDLSDSAEGTSALNTVAARFLDVSVAGEALLTALEPMEESEDSPLTREQFEAIEKMREALRPSLKAVDPVNEGAGADLEK